jgi:hypothetical protein
MEKVFSQDVGRDGRTLISRESAQLKPYDHRDKLLKTLCREAGVKEFAYHPFAAS